MGEPYIATWYLIMCRDSTVQTLRKTSRDMMGVYYAHFFFGAFSRCINGRARHNSISAKIAHAAKLGNKRLSTLNQLLNRKTESEDKL